MSMVGRRTITSNLPPRLYEYKGRRRSTYYYIARDNIRINLGHDLAEAKRQWLELEEGEPVVGTMSELIERYMREVAPKKAPRTYADNTKEAVKLRGVFGKMAPGDIRPKHVAEYLDRRALIAPVRANREKALLSHIFSMGMRWGIVDANPCRGVARNTETPRDRYITDEELKNFCDLARNEGESGLVVAVTVELAYLTGQRRGDILNLHMKQLQEDGIYFQQGKTGAKVLVEWTDLLRTAVTKAKRLPRTTKGMYLICNRKGQRYTESGFGTLWNKLQSKWCENGNEGFHFHDLRAKATTDMMEEGRLARELTGHKSDKLIISTYDRRKVKKSRAVK